MKIVFLGQCGVKLEAEGVSLAIDPVLNDMVENGTDIRIYPPVLSPEELNVDYIFCTHDHIDHMAKETVLRAMNASQTTKVVLPKGCIKEMVEYGAERSRIIGIGDGECEVIGTAQGESIRVTGLSTSHPVHQVDAEGLDHNLLYSIEIDGKRIVHLGDTYLTERLEKSLKDLGQIDAFFAPINGSDAERDAKGIIGNLNCEEAAGLAARLGCKLAVPTHFDMVKGNTADPEEFVEYLQKADSSMKYWVPVLMEPYII